MNTVYETTVSVIGGRNGKVKSDNGVLELDVRLPKSMGGADDSFTNPEQLFAAGYAACFDNALIFIALQKKIKIKSKIDVTVGLQSSDETGFNLCVKIIAKIDGVERQVAQELLEAAHQTCPYSKAISGNVDVVLELI